MLKKAKSARVLLLKNTYFWAFLESTVKYNNMWWRILVGFLVFSAFALGTRWYYMCEIKHLCEDSPVINVDSSALSGRAKTLAVYQGDQAVLKGYEEFMFDYSSHQAVLSTNNETFLTDLAQYCLANPSSPLQIIGRYYENETNSSDLYDILGTARAAAVRDMLRKDYGLDSFKILVDYELLPTPANGINPVPQPLRFVLGEKVLQDSTGASLATASYEFKNMTFSDVNFESGSAVLKPSKQFVVYADSMVRYMAQNPKQSLLIIGHTDSDGKDALNMKLGLDRAISTKKYFQQKGVKNKIATQSEGKKQPVAPNDNPANKARNRRVNIQVVE